MATNPQADKFLKFIDDRKITITSIARMAKINEGTIRAFRDTSGRKLNDRTEISIMNALAWYLGEPIFYIDLFEVDEESEKAKFSMHPPENSAFGKILISKNLSPNEISEKTGLSLKQVEALLFKTSVINEDAALKIALCVDSNIEDIGYTDFRDFDHNYLEPERQLNRLAASSQERTARLPILEIAPGTDGVLVFTDRIVGSTSRPPSLEHSDDGYAVYMPDRSMYPRYEIGEILYINPNKAAALNSDVLVKINKSTQSKPHCVIANLAERDDKTTKFRCFNEDKHYQFNNSDIDLHTIIRGSDLLI